MVTYELLVIIKLITSYELTILATKIIKIGQLGPEIWLFSPYGISAEFSPRSFSWLTHVFTPSIHSWTFLVIIISISTYELTIIATKIMKIGQLGPEIRLFYHFVSLWNSEPWVFHGYSMFHPKLTLMDVSGHHDINQHIWIDHIGHKNHQHWSIVTWIMATFISF